jgi:hypothetical protein
MQKTRPLLLSTQEQLMTYWPQIEPLLAGAPIAEEYPPDKLLQAACMSQMFLFVVLDEQTVELVVVIAPAPSESLPTMNIVTVAGKNLRKHINDYWDYFKGWCIMNGARAIDAYVPDRMEGFVEKLGLKRETVHVRLRL